MTAQEFQNLLQSIDCYMSPVPKRPLKWEGCFLFLIILPLVTIVHCMWGQIICQLLSWVSGSRRATSGPDVETTLHHLLVSRPPIITPLLYSEITDFEFDAKMG